MKISVLRGRSVQVAMAAAGAFALLMSIAAPLVPLRTSYAGEPTPAAPECWSLGVGQLADFDDITAVGAAGVTNTAATINGVLPIDPVANVAIDCDLLTPAVQPPTSVGTSATIPVGGTAVLLIDPDDTLAATTFMADILTVGNITDGLNVTVNLTGGGTFTQTGTGVMTLPCGTPGVVETADAILQAGECFGVIGPFTISGPGAGGLVTVNITMDNPSVGGVSVLPPFTVTFLAGPGGAASSISLTNLDSFVNLSNGAAALAGAAGARSTDLRATTRDPSGASVNGVNIRLNATNGASVLPGGTPGFGSPAAGTCVASEAFASTGVVTPGSADFDACAGGSNTGATVVTATVVSNPVLVASVTLNQAGTPSVIKITADPVELSTSAAVLTTTLKAEIKDSGGNFAGDGTAVAWTAPGIAGVGLTSLGTTTAGVSTAALSVAPTFQGSVVGVSATLLGTGLAASIQVPVKGGAPAAPAAPAPGALSVTPNSPYVSGLNQVVISGSGSSSAVATAIATDSKKVVQALWVVTGGSWIFYLPSDNLGDLKNFAGPLAGAIVALG